MMWYLDSILDTFWLKMIYYSCFEGKHTKLTKWFGKSKICKRQTMKQDFSAFSQLIAK